MFLFSKSYKQSINKDFLKKVNVSNYEKIKSYKGEELNLSFSNFKMKKQQKTKLKHVLALELLSFQKSGFKFILNKSKRKKTYLPSESFISLHKKYIDYFCFGFLKTSVGFIKNLNIFGNLKTLKKIKLETPISFSLCIKNNFYFYDLNEINVQFLKKKLSLNKNYWILQKLSFYKFIL